MPTLDFQSRAAMSIGMVVMAYSKVDQQIYWKIGHLKAERARREREKGSEQEPPDEELSGDFDRRLSLWRRLCYNLSADSQDLMPKINDMVRRLKLAVAVRDDLVHGWISPEPPTGEDATGIRVMNAYDVNQFIKDIRKYDFRRDGYNQPKIADYINVIYSFDRLNKVREDLDGLHWEIMNLTERIIVEFR